LQKKKNLPCIIGVDIEEEKWGFLGFGRRKWALIGVFGHFWDIFFREILMIFLEIFLEKVGEKMVSRGVLMVA
jgi:hypothetical protein